MLYKLQDVLISCRQHNNQVQTVMCMQPFSTYQRQLGWQPMMQACLSSVAPTRGWGQQTSHFLTQSAGI